MIKVRFVGGPASGHTQDTHFKLSRMPPTMLPVACPIPIREGMYVKHTWVDTEKLMDYQWTPVGGKHGRI